MNKNNHYTLLLSLALLVNTTLLMAQDSISDALSESSFDLNFRYRYETVDLENLEQDAVGHTVRTRLGLTTGNWNGWFASVQVEDITALRDDFNDTRNGQTQFPLIVDPEQTELNNLYVGYANDSTQFNFGRQTLKLGNERFIGDVGWRQNNQTFDAAYLHHDLNNDWSFDYIYFNNVNRIFGQDHPNPVLANRKTDSHVLEAQYSFGFHQLKAYAHLFSFDDIPGQSHRNLGIRYSGQWGENPDKFNVLLDLEYTVQDDYDEGLGTIDASYTAADLTFEFNSDYFLLLGYERLSGDGQYGFATPFATLHKFNGWVDAFLTTPTVGLIDQRIVYGGTWNDFTFDFRYHQFDSDERSIDLGTEIDWQVEYAFNSNLKLLLKYANYNSENFAQEWEIIWAQVQFDLL